MTIRINITACEGSSNDTRRAWFHWDERYPPNGEWMPGKAPPVPLNRGETQTFWIHSGQRVVVYESEDGTR